MPLLYFSRYAGLRLFRFHPKQQGDNPVSNIIKRFIKEESGATMVEYAILVALIAVAVIVTVGILGGKIDATFQKVVNAMP